MSALVASHAAQTVLWSRGKSLIIVADNGTRRSRDRPNGPVRTFFEHLLQKLRVKYCRLNTKLAIGKRQPNSGREHSDPLVVLTATSSTRVATSIRLSPFPPSDKSMAHIVVDDDNIVSQQVLLRINAANLPRHGILQALPDSYAVVSSVSVPNGQDGVNFDLSQTYVNNSLNGSNSHGQTKIEWGKTEMYVGTQRDIQMTIEKGILEMLTFWHTFCLPLQRIWVSTLRALCLISIKRSKNPQWTRTFTIDYEHG